MIFRNKKTGEIKDCSPTLLNAALVSAQNRKRLFWVGKLVNGKYEQVKIEQPEDKNILLKDILEQEVDEKYIVQDSHNYNRKSYGAKGKILEDEIKSPTLQAAMGTGGGNNILIKDKSNTIRTSGRGSGVDDKHNWDTIRIGQIGKGGQGDRIYSPEGKSVNLSANGGGRGAKTGLYAVALRNRGEGKKPEIGGDKANSMTTVQTDSMVMEDTLIRKLTPIECERLQSLPDGFTEGISNTQRYKALGNGFNCAVIEHILKQIML